jgi:hypothetical protein
MFIYFKYICKSVILIYGYSQYIHEFVQRCAADVMHRSSLKDLFDDGLSRTGSETALSYESLFHEWTRKLMHARMNEFFTSHREQQIRKTGSKAKGGHTLRDTLFALSKRQTVKGAKISQRPNVSSVLKKSQSVAIERKNSSNVQASSFVKNCAFVKEKELN